jgi:small subunit ribosomal protein S6
MVLYAPLLLEDIKKNTLKKVLTHIEKNGGKLDEVENLGKRLLAYPIKKYQEGHYILYKLTYSSSNIKKLENELKLTENILRFLLIKK